MAMATHEILRPGITQGNYPERTEPKQDWLDQVVLAARTFLPIGNSLNKTDRQKLIQYIDRYGKSLKALSESQLSQQRQTLGYRLRTEGLRREPVLQTFALVREVADRVLGMRHFDVQLLGGWILLQGQIAEMETGEGKTLTATLPACTAALAGIPVHIITVNDYLANRDAALMTPLYQTLGLTVGVIKVDMDPAARQKAYACDITYCTNKQLTFDYLRDQLTLGSQQNRLAFQCERLYNNQPRIDQLLLRGLCFAIVDEADSVLIDEARTPLILSRESDSQAQQQLYTEALHLAKQLQDEVDFHIDHRDRTVTLSEKGKLRLQGLSQPLGSLWQATRRREALICQGLRALHLYQRDQDYLIRDDTVQIIDEFTGRVMADRSWEGGLHQLIEVKEHCSLSNQKETLARISYQQFFRRYLRLAGMTGTAQEVANELRAVYGIGVVKISPRLPLKRVQYPTQVFPSQDKKWQALVKRVRIYHDQQRPVLIGTRSLAASEQVSHFLHSAGLHHEVLNARQDLFEATLIAHAGEPGRITVATNMAGRGTDIRLASGVADLGGLHIIATERHESGRIDRQLFGRCGRQGEPGSFECLLSLEDEIVMRYSPRLLHRFVSQSGGKAGAFGGRLSRFTFSLAQRLAEHHHAGLRRDLLKVDKHLENLLAFSGRSL
jgi:preprotein translocase subunit SecA